MKIQRKIFSFIFSLLEFFTIRQKYLLFFFIFLTFVGSFSEILSVSSTLLFAELIINPENLNKYFSYINYDVSEYLNNKKFLFFIAAIFIFVIILSAIVKALIIYLSLKLGYGIAHTLNLNTIKSSATYKFYANKKNNLNYILSSLQKNHDVSIVVNSFTLLTSSTFISISIFCLMIVMDPYITLIVTSIVGSFYLIINYILKGKINQNSKDIAQHITKKTYTVTNTFNLLKNIILNNLQNAYVNKFRYYDKLIMDKTIFNNLIAFLPGLIIVTIIIIFIIIGISLISLSSVSIIDQIPKLTALVFSTQRIIPNIQQIYYSITRTKAHIYSANDALNFIKENKNINFKSKKYKKLNFKNKIELKNIFFKYSKDFEIFKKINLKIKKNSKILVEGKSGIGKSTLIDIILGILKPSRGRLKVDKTIIDKKNFINWNQNISYLSQDTFIVEGNFYENVALDNHLNKVSKKRVIECCKRAEIHNFITSKKNSYDHQVSFSGKDLSNGQKQRLGIARALFKDPNLLIMDESTNSIDLYNEKKIFKNLEKLRNLTIIHISHRKDKNKIFNKKIIFKNKKIFMKNV